MHPPRFWQAGAEPPRLLAPIARVTGWVTARRVARPGWVAGVPVICCGNVTVGGAGKTTVALDLGARLSAQGMGAQGQAVHFLTRGYGGSARGMTRVDSGATAAQVGDEPLLLAAVAPTWVSADRAAAARCALAAGADVLIMDDGLQNPTLQKTLSLLVIDGRTGFGNGHMLPAGPLRESVAAAAGRCGAAIVVGADQHGAIPMLPPGLLVLRARLVAGPGARALAGQKVLAFAGIASPDKFFNTLIEAGAEPIQRVAFADHHPYRPHEITALLQQAARAGLRPVTTAKDAVRLPPALRAQVHVADVTLQWDDTDALMALLKDALHVPRIDADGIGYAGEAVLL
jgi:tetraacyldisaccharide 4'-kinase